MKKQKKYEEIEEKMWDGMVEEGSEENDDGYYRCPKSLVKVPSKILPSGVKLILIILKDFEERGEACFAGNKWLSENAGIGLKQLKRILLKLERMGILKRKREEDSDGSLRRHLYITKDYDFSKLSSQKFTRG